MITLVVAATASTAVWEKFGANSLTCDVCELLIGGVESFIGSNATFADVLNSLDFFCNHITPSGPYRESCLKYAMEIADGLPELTSIITRQALDPHAVCAIAGGICRYDCCVSDATPEQHWITLGQSSATARVTWITSLRSAGYTPVLLLGSTPITVRGQTFQYDSLGWDGLLHSAQFSTDSFGGVGAVVPFTAAMLPPGGGAPVMGQPGSFVVPPAPGDPTAGVFVVGDMGLEDIANGTMLGIASRIGTLQDGARMSVVLHDGDISYADGVAWRWDAYFRKMESAAMGSWSHRVPIMTTPGNHEIVDNFAAYKNRLHQFTQENRTDTLSHSFAVGPIFFAATSGESPFNTPDVPDATLRWLNAALSSVNRSVTPWVVVALHRPLYCEETPCLEIDAVAYLRQRLEATFLNHGVDLVITAHRHYYSATYPLRAGATCTTGSGPASFPTFSAPGCPVYVISGNGGCREGHERWKDVEYLRTGSSLTGYGTLVANRTTLTWREWASVDGSALDQFMITK